MDPRDAKAVSAAIDDIQGAYPAPFGVDAANAVPRAVPTWRDYMRLQQRARTAEKPHKHGNHGRQPHIRQQPEKT